MALPRHVAIIMDGNGRWARNRLLPRVAGHRAGIAPVRLCIEQCARQGIGALTLFAFSSENWSRPAEEVGSLMGLFLDALDREVDELHTNQVCLRFIGERGMLSAALQQRIAAAEARTAANARLSLQVAVSYGGRWDLAGAARQLARQCQQGLIAADGGTVDRRPAGSRPVHPHRWRAAHQQFPAVEPGIHRAVLHRPALARF